MRLLILLLTLTVPITAFAAPPFKTEQDRGYPISAALSKKLNALSQKADKLQTDVENLSLSPEANYQINEIEHILTLVSSLLDLEAVHAGAGQFNEKALQSIKQAIAGCQSILKRIPDQCAVDMQGPGVFPEEHAYLEKIKDLSLESDRLMNELVNQLSALRR